MELNVSTESSGNGTNVTEADIVVANHPAVSYLILFGLTVLVILAVVPALAVIIIVLKDRKLREKNNNVFYVNLLIADVIASLTNWMILCSNIISNLLDLSNVNHHNIYIAYIPRNTSVFTGWLMFLFVVIDRCLIVLLYLLGIKE